MITDWKVNYNEFVKFTANGLQIATFVQIKDALIERFKQIYGTDIDITGNTADAQYIHTIALIFNNQLQTIKMLYDNLNPASAQGRYLDILCSLSNVKRQSATRSSTTLLISNASQNKLEFIKGQTYFEDVNGNNWRAIENKTIEPNIQNATLLVECVTFGPIVCPAGSIRFIESTNATLIQENDADIGSYQETDDELRARRNNAIANQGSTVIESLEGALLNLAAIKDVNIEVNSNNDTKDALDGTIMPAHTVYVVLRYKNNVQKPSDLDIATILYNKLTPGINTVLSYQPGAKSYQMQITNTNITETYHWRVAQPIHPPIIIKLNTMNYFDSVNTPNIIGNKIIEYCNNLALDRNLYANELISEVVLADPKFRGLLTYNVSSVEIGSSNDSSHYSKMWFFDGSETTYDNEHSYTTTIENSTMLFNDLTIDASSGKLAYNTAGYTQMNANTKLSFTLAKDAKVTIKTYPGQHNYTVNDAAATSDVMTFSLPSGTVEIVATNTSYIYSISYTYNDSTVATSDVYYTENCYYNYSNVHYDSATKTIIIT